MQKIFNCLGVDITNTRILLLSPDYGYVDENNIPHIEWGSETEKCDRNGFDKEFRPVDGSNVYIIKDFVLQRGTMLCRYGTPTGYFTTIKGTSYDSLGLPYVRETIEYHEYKVSEDILVECRVVKGKVAPKFKSEGGAIQFLHKQTIKRECEGGFLQEDFQWKLKSI